jgi:hypothetical protein
MRLTPAALLLALACLMPVAAKADAYADFVLQSNSMTRLQCRNFYNAAWMSTR